MKTIHPSATQLTRQIATGAKNPTICLDNRKPYRTKQQLTWAVKARRGEDGAYHSAAQVTYHKPFRDPLNV